jgi:hypothetical protein
LPAGPPPTTQPTPWRRRPRRNPARTYRPHDTTIGGPPRTSAPFRDGHAQSGSLVPGSGTHPLMPRSGARSAQPRK